MEKFSLFELVSKLLSDEKSQNALKSTLQNLFTTNQTNQNKENKNKIAVKPEQPNKLSKIAINELYKRHDEISKQINKSLNSTRK